MIVRLQTPHLIYILNVVFFKYNLHRIEKESGNHVVLKLELATETWYRVWGLAPDDDLKNYILAIL